MKTDVAVSTIDGTTRYFKLASANRVVRDEGGFLRITIKPGEVYFFNEDKIIYFSVDNTPKK